MKRLETVEDLQKTYWYLKDLVQFCTGDYADTLHLAHSGTSLLPRLGETPLQCWGDPGRAQHRGGSTTIDPSAVPIPRRHPPPYFRRREHSHFRRCGTWRRMPR